MRKTLFASASLLALLYGVRKVKEIGATTAQLYVGIHLQNKVEVAQSGQLKENFDAEANHVQIIRLPRGAAARTLEAELHTMQKYER